MHISLFVAIAENGVIGQDNAMPWRLSSDLKRLKALTMGKPILMGRKTWESFPKRPLPGRPNLIVTRDADYDAPGGEVFTSTEAALARGEDLARELQVDEIMVLGGAQIYKALLPRATRIYLTEVHAAPEGDTTFDFDKSAWREVSRERHEAGEKDSAAYSFVLLERL
ncbi:dihydrofolate reductase [Tepidicaulis sp. LMO-SS28]|uniref:dihydrofolate reductase n=1 Tax=Tepidicaulis sp. LMO-SS28 TaxID=3447455 RepID=UPI003EE206F8